jgi:hypothetical protein
MTESSFFPYLLPGEVELLIRHVEYRIVGALTMAEHEQLTAQGIGD